MILKMWILFGAECQKINASFSKGKEVLLVTKKQEKSYFRYGQTRVLGYHWSPFTLIAHGGPKHLKLLRLIHHHLDAWLNADLFAISDKDRKKWLPNGLPLR